MRRIYLINFLFLLICSIIVIPASGQSRKEARDNKTKSTTIWQTENIEGVNKNFKESYEEFDKNGNSVMMIEYKKDGSIKKKTSKSYNKENKKTEEIEYDSGNEIVTRTSITYNSDGEKNIEIIKDANGKVLKKNFYKYNNKNMKIERQTYNSAGELESTKKWVYEYYN